MKAFRLASDRIRATGGVIAYVSNNSFIDQIAFDGMRKHLAQGFSTIYVIDLGGNVRKNPKLSGTTHNVFGIQVGVAITILVKHAEESDEREKRILYARMPEDWRRGQKTAQLDEWKDVGGAEWTQIKPDGNGTWLTAGHQGDWPDLLPLAGRQGEDKSVFRSKTQGVSTNRDATVYSSDSTHLGVRVRAFIDRYNSEVRRYREAGSSKEVDTFLNYSELKWSRNLKRHLLGGDEATFSAACIRTSIYRPFTKRFCYLADILVDEPSKSGAWSNAGNAILCVSGVASAQPFPALVTETPTSLDLLEKTQCFPFYTYDEDGTNRKENITDWALDQYRTHYNDPSITKWDIFHSTYALLHHLEYRTRYAANLKRELPRIPFPPDLQAFVKAGKRLMELHINYEQQPEYPLEEIEQPKAAWTLRVERMSLSKDKSELRYNDALTLRGIPAAASDYRLGNRSALEWVIDQYRVSIDARSGIVNDPNRADDERISSA